MGSVYYLHNKYRQVYGPYTYQEVRELRESIKRQGMLVVQECTDLFDAEYIRKE